MPLFMINVDTSAVRVERGGRRGKEWEDEEEEEKEEKVRRGKTVLVKQRVRHQ